MKTAISFLLLGIALCIVVPSAGAQPSKTSRDTVSAALYEDGNTAFINGDCPRAIIYYRQLFDREKAKRSLSPAAWRTFINNFGMAYGVSRKLDNAEEIFRYGISKDPKYPLFYYNLACVYGERNDLKHSIEYLKIAFRIKARTGSREMLPNPLSVDPFRNFYDNKTFIDAVTKMVPKHQAGQ
jgi:tetratricopeptide (TPR) repeat protein